MRSFTVSIISIFLLSPIALGQDAASLVRDLRAPETGSSAATALAKMGDKAIPALVAFVKESPDDAAFLRAAFALGRIGTPAKEAVPLLTARLSKLTAVNQVIVLDALGHIGPGAGEAVSTLSDLLRTSENSSVKIAAVVALGKIGPEAKAATPLLLEAARSAAPTEPVSVHMMDTLIQIGAPASDVSPILIERLKANAQPRQRYLDDLAKLAPLDKQMLPTVEEWLRDKDPQIQVRTARILGKSNPNHPAVVSVLIQAFENNDAQVRILAAEILGEIRPRDEAVVQVLERARTDMDASVRKAAEEALAKFKK